MKKLLGLLILISAPAVLRAQDEKEWFRLEVTGTYWYLGPRGDVQSGATRVDLRSDLGMQSNTSQFWGRLALKPARKHQFIFEAIPYRFNGDHQLARQITYAGITYDVSDHVTSDAELNYFFGGYQYDVLNRARGHLGLLGGVSVFDASGTIRSELLAKSSSDEITVPFPLAGAEFQAFLLPKSRLLSVGAEVKGMFLGAYGQYIESGFRFGIGLGRHVTVLGGYAIVDADVHQKNRPEGVNLRFTGPTLSLQFRDR